MIEIDCEENINEKVGSKSVLLHTCGRYMVRLVFTYD